jgi:hypothetical protein
MEMVRSHVVTIEVKEQLPNRSLSQILEGWVEIRVESGTSPGIAYATGATARYP